MMVLIQKYSLTNACLTIVKLKLQLSTCYFEASSQWVILRRRLNYNKNEFCNLLIIPNVQLEEDFRQQ